jgi:PAS domain S-box-containing protein
MPRLRTVLAPDQELFKFCSIFDLSPLASILFDSEGLVLYHNSFFEKVFGSKINSVEDFKSHIPELNVALFPFLENDVLFEEFELTGWNIAFRRVVSREKEFVMATLKPVGENISEQDDSRSDYVLQTAQLNAFVEYNTIPAAMFDRDMNYINVGQKWLDLYPTDSGADIIGKNYYHLHPNIPRRWRLQHMKAMEGSTVSNPRDMHIRANGNKEWFKWMAKPWFEQENVIGGIIIYAEIVTERVESEIASRKQEIKYKSYFENTTLGWMEVDANELVEYCRKTSAEHFSERKAVNLLQQSKVIEINDQLRDIFDIHGMPAADFEPTEFIKENIHGFLWKMVGSFRNSDNLFEHELVIENRQKQRKNIYISVRLPKGDDFGNIIFGVLDVTDFKNSIVALRESEERYRTMFESNSLGVVYTNYKKSMIRVNPAFSQMFGYTEDEMQFIDEKDLLIAKFRKLNDSMVESFKNGTKRFVTVEKEYKRKNGKRLIANTSSSALFDASGAHYGTVTIIDDITERKINERKIRKQNVELTKINRELDQFVYSAAHDLRAPIANVLGLVKLLKLEDLSVAAEQYVGLQEKSIDKLDEFIRSIVDYSRNSRSGFLKKDIDFESFIPEVTQQYGYLDNADKLKISVSIDQPVPFVTDSSRLSIIMNNMVSNAVRYMDTTKAKPFLSIKVKCTKREAIITVQDNGIGIEKEHLGSIFDMFYRATADSKGTGIGLYIVHETVAKIQGRIEVKSIFNEGTTFVVTLKNFAKQSPEKNRIKG